MTEPMSDERLAWFTEQERLCMPLLPLEASELLDWVRCLRAENNNLKDKLQTAARPEPAPNLENVIGYVVVTPPTRYSGPRMTLERAREFAAAHAEGAQVCALVPVEDAP